jgi:mRNA deadenylase 3'-5' endonuclease subunit Ccr4
MVDKGTRLDEDPSLLSVLNYNLLAPIYVRPVDQRTGKVQEFAAFEWAEPADEVLAWGKRQPRLLGELQRSGADIICLQEVQFEVGQNPDSGDELHTLPEWLQLEGYEAVLPSQGNLRQMAERNERVLQHKNAVGNAILFRQDRLERCDPVVAVTSEIPSTNGQGKKKKGGKDKKGQTQDTTRVMVCLRGKKGTPLEQTLADPAIGSATPTGMGKMVVGSLHLDATSEEKRVEQMSRCLEYARKMGTRDSVLMGDLNTGGW